MAKPKRITLTQEQMDRMNFLLVKYGYFAGSDRIGIEFKFEDDVIDRLKQRMFNHILVKIAEAKREVPKVQAALHRLEQVCKAGASRGAGPGSVEKSPDVGALRAAMQAFDGWVISLLETDISLLAVVNNPETAGQRVNMLKQAFAELWDIRVGEGFKPFNNHSEVFDMSLAQGAD